MSEYHIPFHIQEEIMKRLPVKSLIQFRSVSKTWKSLIDSYEFIASHSLRCHSHPQHLLVSYEDPRASIEIIICHSYIDDETFPQQRSLLTLPPPLSAQQIVLADVVGSSRGLVCLPDHKTHMALLWNPSIRKSVLVAAPTRASGLGFGVCPVTNDPKIVSIKESSWYVPETSYRCEVMVSSGEWRSLSTNLPTKPIRELVSGSVVTDQFIYWDVKLTTRNMIMSFDLTSESFEAIDLPDHCSTGDMRISKLRDSVALLQYGVNNDIDFCSVWMMEHGAHRSFTQLYTIQTIDEIAGFRKNGVPIIFIDDDDEDDDDYPLNLLFMSPT